MIKLIASTLLISTLFFMGLFIRVIKLNEEVGLEIYHLEEDISDYETLLKASTGELRECKHTRNEYQKYFSVYELNRRIKLFNQPAIDWENLE